METPIIVFTDDVDVFESSEGVITYFEPWIIEEERCEAFDSEGRVLNLIVKSERKKFIGVFSYVQEALLLQETNDFKADELKLKIKDYIKRYPNLSIDMEKLIRSDLSMMSHKELFKILIEIKGFTNK